MDDTAPTLVIVKRWGNATPDNVAALSRVFDRYRRDSTPFRFHVWLFLHGWEVRHG